jgi:hypothetical protein
VALIVKCEYFFVAEGLPIASCAIRHNQQPFTPVGRWVLIAKCVDVQDSFSRTTYRHVLPEIPLWVVDVNHGTPSLCLQDGDLRNVRFGIVNVELGWTPSCLNRIQAFGGTARKYNKMSLLLGLSASNECEKNQPVSDANPLVREYTASFPEYRVCGNFRVVEVACGGI